MSCFLLGGRAWAVIRVQHGDRRILAQPAPRGKEPTWGGFIPQFLGFELCQRILRVLTDGEAFPYLDDTAAKALAEHRDTMPSNLAPVRGGVQADGDEIRWWTFAGGRINATLRYALEAVGGDWKIIPDNFLIKIRGESATRACFGAALAKLREIEFWENEKLWTEVAESLPSYRLSKFQPLMPPWVEREVVANYLLDIGGAWRWISGREEAMARIPAGVRELTAEDRKRAARLEKLAAARPFERDLSREIVWVRSVADLTAAAAELIAEPVIGLDVETTIDTHLLCVIQLAAARRTYLIDVLEVAEFGALRAVLESTETTKVIHNAEFEREVLGRHGLTLNAVVDTQELSRAKHGTNAEEGHSLRAVARRELGHQLDKSQQLSDWRVRPLSDAQVTYAALDAEILLTLYSELTKGLDDPCAARE